MLVENPLLMAEEDHQPFRDEESLRFFFGLSSRDVATRSQALDVITQTCEHWLDGYGSPTREHSITENHNDFPKDTKKVGQSLVLEQLPDLLRLSLTCPFGDVRERCSSLLIQFEERGIKLPRHVTTGPNAFIPDEEVQPVDCDDEETQSLFVDAFLQNNRLEHMVQVMGYHPQYLDCFLRTQHYMLRGDGPLPYEYRHYIAILAAARHQCSYLVRLHTTEFLLQGGDPEWLKGLDNIPQKLKDLNEVNKLLAHRPWLINKTHIEKLTRGSDNWSMSEVMHALALLAHFHALSSFIYGSGINAEIDHENGHSFDPAEMDFLMDEIEPALEANHENQLECNRSGHGSVSNSHSASPNSFQDNGGGMIDTILMRMKKLTEEEPAETTQEEMLKRFEKVEHQSAQLHTSTAKPSPKADMLLYVDDADFTYEDFAMRGPVSKIPTFRAQDYTWEDHGYSLANRLYTDIGTLIDDKFRIAYNLTYYTMGDNVDVDTSAFRRAIWNYIHCMFGIRHDDYDYGEVNILLERSLKSYIKTVTCYPEQTTKKDYDSFMLEFKDSEKVHVNLMLLEARLQAELLYALRAITRYMT